MTSPLTQLSDEERMFQSTVRKFARERIGPHVRAMDEAGVFRKELLRELFELGLMGIGVAEELGGQGGTFFQSVLAIEELAKVDPAAAAVILPGNIRRIVRALEVIELTGRQFTATLPEPRYLNPATQLGLRLDRETLNVRIAVRVEAMFEAGLVAEVEALVARGLREGRTASHALGYAQVLDHLDGRCSQDEAQEATIFATRRFARRQQKWFERDPRVHWLDADRPDLHHRPLCCFVERSSQSWAA